MVIFRNKFIFLSGVLIFLAFYLIAVTSLDPDFGWHIRMGQIISQTGIPKTDPLSYTMPSFPFVDHEWLTNLLIYKLYSLTNYEVVAAVYSFLALLVLALAFPKKLYKYSWPSLFLSAGILIIFSGIRTQITTWVLFAFLVKILFDLRLWQKWRIVLPAIFLLWANLHAGFAAGVVTLVFVIALRSILDKKFYPLDYLIALLSILVTLINPYGLRLWGEVWMQISDSALHTEIVEWIPGVFFVDFAFLFLIALTIFFIYYFWKHHLLKKVEPIKLALFFALLFAAMSTARHIPLWVIVAAPLFSQFLEIFYDSVKKDQFAQKASRQFYKALSIGVLGLFLFEFWIGYRGAKSLSESYFYPAQAITYLKSHPFSGHVFSIYGWGGYLDWKYPEQKVFIDGRMPSWRYSSAPSNESNYAFQDLDKILGSGADYVVQFNKYQINTVLWPVAKKDNTPEKISQIRHWYNFLIDNLFNNKAPAPSLTARLSSNGWKKVYEDSNAVIYQK